MNDTRVRAAPAAEVWLREAFDHVLVELSLFGRTFAAFVFHPGRSARAWQAGDRAFMNPLGFAAAAAGAYWAVVSALAALWPIAGAEGADTLADQIASAVGPYVHYGLLGVAMHLALRSLGSRRSLVGSIGIAFFTGGSIGTAGALLFSSVARWFAHVRGTDALEMRAGDPVPLVLFGGAVLFYALVCLAMARGLMGLHHAAGWKSAIAAAFAVVVTALLFGSVMPEGAFGWRPYIAVQLEGGFGLAFGFRG